jgi:hypothetical protein
MTRKNIQNNQLQDDNVIDVTGNVSFKVKLSPKVKELIATTTEASKTVVKVGQKLLPILLVLGTIATSCAPKHLEPNSPAAPLVESTKKAQP